MRVKYLFSSRFAQKTRKPSYTNQHKVSFPKQAREVIQLADVVLEILDARFIDKTRNAELEAVVKEQGKKIIYVLNKADLVNVGELKRNYDLSSIEPYIFFSSKNKIGRARLRELISREASKVKFEKARVGVIGYPNTGKSSLINVLSGGKRAGTSSQAGFTTSIQKIKFSKNIIIIDSPGVILRKEENSHVGSVVKKQTEIGVKNYERVRYPDFVVHEIMKENKGIFDEFYGINSGNDVEILLETLGKKWRLLKKGGTIDLDRTARKILRDWQEGKIRGKIQ